VSSRQDVCPVPWYLAISVERSQGDAGGAMTSVPGSVSQPDCPVRKVAGRQSRIEKITKCRIGTPSRGDESARALCAKMDFTVQAKLGSLG
jgi:hypothetical protein